jgi:hypothetical protein
MALISDLVAAIAEAEGIPEPTVAMVARHLREAGLLSTGARGRNAPAANVRDCINLLIGVNVPYAVLKDAPKAVRAYRNLVLYTPDSPHRPPTKPVEKTKGLFAMGEGATLATFLESIFAQVGEIEHHLYRLASEFVSDADAKFAAKNWSLPLDGARHVLTQAAMRGDRLRFKLKFYGPVPMVRFLADRELKGERVELGGATFVSNLHTTTEVIREKVKNSGDQRRRTEIGWLTFHAIAVAMDDGK